MMAVLALLAGLSFLADAALTPSYYTSESVLMTGKWVKIKVRNTGMHQITDEQLREMGFSDPSKVAVYGYSGLVFADNRLSSDIPDDLPPVPVARHNGKLIFYAEGDVSLRVARVRVNVDADAQEIVDVNRNYFADYSTYFLTDALPLLEPDKVPYVPSGKAPVTVSKGMSHYEEEVQNEGQIGARFLGPTCGSRPVQDYSFSMPGYKGESPVGMYYLVASRIDKDAYVKIDHPGGQSGNLLLKGQKESEYCYALTAHYFADRPAVADGYSAGVDFTNIGAGYGALEYFTALYPRGNELGDEVQSEFVFTSLSSDAEIEFNAPEDKTWVWDVTRGSSPRSLETVAAGSGAVRCSSPGSYNLVGSGNAAYLQVFNPDADLYEVECIGDVECPNLHGLPTPRMLIVAARNFIDEAERLAEAHRLADNIDVAVVLQDDVFNEFSSGAPHAMAIRRFVRMLADKEPGKLRSLLLFGGASYDNRGIAAYDKEAFRRTYVPVFVCSDPSTVGHRSRSYCTDAYMGMLAENSGSFDIARELMGVNVSRIPAQSVADATTYVDKAIGYIMEPPVSDFSNRALLMCDDGDHLGHMKDADSIAAIIERISPATTVFRAYNTIYPFKGGSALDLNSHVVGALAKGVGYFGYSGHAALSKFGAEDIWSIRLVRDTEYAVPPFTMLATCRGLFFDNNVESVGEAMLFKKGGGSIAVVSSLREVYKEQNQVLNLAVGNAYFSASDGCTMGDVFRIARNNVIESCASLNGANERVKLAVNTLCYNMAGDPEIRLRVPTHTVSVTSAAGEPLTASETTLAAGEPIEIAGEVRDASGEIDTDFNGQLVIGVYDAEKTMQVINIHSTDKQEEKQVKVRMDEDQIYEKHAEVRQGRFNTSLYLPLPARQGSANRFSMFAANDDNSVHATGSMKNVVIGNMSSDEEPDGRFVPQITEMYLDDPSFADGDLVGGSVTLFATLAPNEVGVVGNSTLIGRSMRLTLDGGRTFSEAAGSFVSDVDGGGRLSFALSGISDGRHELTLTVSNYAGQTVSRSVRFEVVNIMSDASLSVAEYPASVQATIDVTHNFTETPSGRVVVKNASGDVVHTKENVSFPYAWDLTGADGTDVPEGVYSVEAYLKGGIRYGYGRPAEIVVSRD